MSSSDHATRLLNSLHSSTQHFAENSCIQIFGPGNKINCHQYLTTHSIHIAHSVSGSNRAKCIWIIHNGREKISSTDNSLLVVYTIDGRIIDCIQTNQQLWGNITLSKRTDNLG